MLHKSLDGADTARRAHMTLKAVTTTTDQGLFESVISTESVDREKDIVSAAGMVAALQKWNRPIPLSWNHSTKAEDIFGNVDSQTARAVAREVVVNGQVDLGSAVGAEAWRSFKSRSVGFSFGYLILASTKRAGGGRHISELDIFEITATPTPMNNDTRVLSTKGVEDRKQLASVTSELLEEAGSARYGSGPDTSVCVDDFDPDNHWVVYSISSISQDDDRYVKTTYTATADGVTLGDTDVEVERSTTYTPKGDAETLRKQAARIAREVEQAQIPTVPEPPKAPALDEDLTKELQEVKALLAETREQVDALKKKADATDKEPKARSVDPLRKQADAVALEIASDGQSLRRPPKTVAPTAPDLIPLDELKRRMRDEMLGVLSGGITE